MRDDLSSGTRRRLRAAAVILLLLLALYLGYLVLRLFVAILALAPNRTLPDNRDCSFDCAAEQAIATKTSRVHLPPFVVPPKPKSDSAARELAQ